jgi:hypothetical protein
MAKAKKEKPGNTKSAKEASNLFHNIMKASVTNTPTNDFKPHIAPVYIDGRYFEVKISQDGKKIRVGVYEVLSDEKKCLLEEDHKINEQAAELLSIAKEWISDYVINKS